MTALAGRPPGYRRPADRDRRRSGCRAAARPSRPAMAAPSSGIGEVIAGDEDRVAGPQRQIRQAAARPAAASTPGLETKVRSPSGSTMTRQKPLSPSGRGRSSVGDPLARAIRADAVAIRAGAMPAGKDARPGPGAPRQLRMLKPPPALTVAAGADHVAATRGQVRHFEPDIGEDAADGKEPRARAAPHQRSAPARSASRIARQGWSRSPGLAALQCRNGLLGEAAGAVAGAHDGACDRRHRIAIAAKARRQTADPPGVLWRHGADGERRRHRLIGRDAGADQPIDEIERFAPRACRAPDRAPIPSAPRPRRRRNRSRVGRPVSPLRWRAPRPPPGLRPPTPALTAAATAEAPAIAIVVLWVTWPV